MSMIRCKMVAGYSGSLGDVTAEKCFILPFIPTKGMLFDVDNWDWTHDDDQPYFNINTQTYHFGAGDADDTYASYIEAKCLNDIIEHFTRADWEVLDWSDGTAGEPAS